VATDHEPMGTAAPPVPGEGDHLRGSGPEAIVYLDLACPRCAGTWAEIARLPLRLCVRHFPMSAKRPRSPALHAASEAAAAQSEEGFWLFWDSLLADRSHVDDPHLWERAERFGLDLDRFQRDRRSADVAARVRRDFVSGIRAGVTETPSGFTASGPLRGDLAEQLRALAEAGS